MADGKSATIPFSRLLVHVLFLGLAIYVIRETSYRLFADTWLVDAGKARRAAIWVPIVLVTAFAHRLFDRLFPLVDSDKRAPGKVMGRNGE